MKYTFLVIGMISFLASTISFGQKSNVSSAILAFRKYNPTEGIDPSKKILNSAKEFIDLAAVNAETSTSTYMHCYRGQIYYSLIEIAAIEASMSGAKPEENTINDYRKKVIESFDVVLNTPKSKDQKTVIDFVSAKMNNIENMGITFFNSRNYVMATETFIAAFETGKFAHLENAETKNNIALAFIRSVDTLLILKDFEIATELGNKVYEISPKNIEILISLINLNLQKNDPIASERYLNEATSLDTTNKQLYCVLGASLMELQQNEKAAEAFVKALKIDPTYPQAIYQLGTHLFNWSRELSNSAGDLNPNDPKIEELNKKSNDLLLRTLSYVDPYLLAFPNDKSALEIAWKSNYMLGNEEKYQELKKKWETIE